MNTRPLAFILFMACQTAFASPTVIADTGAAIAAQSAAAATRIRGELRQALHRAPHRVALPAPTAAVRTTLHQGNTPVATIAQPANQATTALH